MTISQTVKKIIPGLFFVLIPAAYFIFFNLLSQSNSYTILSHSYKIRPFFTGLFLIPVIILLMAYWYKKTIPALKLKKEQNSILHFFYPYSPLFLLLFSPFLLNQYFDRQDFKLRLGALFIIVHAVVLYMIFQKSSSNHLFRKKLNNLFVKFSTLSLRKKLVILFLAAFLIYNGCTFLLVSKGIVFSGDEPYYLLTAHSIYQDQDINVWNNYAQKDYFHFYDKDKNPNLKLGIYARDGRRGEKDLYPINLSGISFLMQPHYWLSQHFTGKMRTFILKGSLSIWAVFLGLQLFLFSLERWKKESLSLGLWFLFSFSVPVLFYATHLYPEILIAFFSIYIYRKIHSKKPHTKLNLIFLGFVLSLFFWFGLKYNMIFFPLLLISLYIFIKVKKLGWNILYFLAPPLISMGLFYLYLYELYGAFSPFSIYEGVMTPEKVKAFKEMIVKIPVMLRIDTFVDYFLDQRDGLLLYSPFYVFGLLGMIEAFKRAKRDCLFLLFISFPFILNYAFFSHRQGFCPQARIIAPISWVAILFVGYFLVFNKSDGFKRFFWITSFAGLMIMLLLLFHPSFLYQPTTHEFTSRPGDLFVFLSNIHIFLPHFLPSFIKVNNLGYLPNYIWIFGIILFVSIYLLRKKITLKIRLKPIVITLGLIISLGLWVIYPRIPLFPTQSYHYSEGGSLGYYFFSMGKGMIVHREAELYLHRAGDYKIVFSSIKKLDKVKVKFGSSEGKYNIKYSFFDLPSYQNQIDHNQKIEILPVNASYKYKHLFLYELSINIDHSSSELMVRNPFFFQIIPVHD